MDKELISIVIPIYNVEKYITKCIESVRQQTYKNIEIILIDDGSPDNCGKICDEYTKIDNRIQVIHKENGGLSDARNTGIDIAKGNYIVFVDSDDFIELTFVEELYNAIVKNNAEISICNINIINEKNKKIGKTGYEDMMIVKGKTILEKICQQKNIIESIVAWNKMYSIKFFKTYKYPVGKIHEDEFLTYKILYQADKVAIINKYLYNYRKNNESIVGKKFNKQRLDLIDALFERIDFYKKNNENYLYLMTMKLCLNQLIEYYIKTKKYIENPNLLLKELKNKYKMIYKEYIKEKSFSTKMKSKAVIFRYFSCIFYILKKNHY